MRAHVTFEKMTRRRIFVGDVHGCFDELMLLMNEVNFEPEKDTLVSVGDLFRKGPLSGEVMDWARRNHVLCVRGNHEERLLKQRKKWTKGNFDPTENPDTPLMSRFSDADFEWLKALPYSIDFPQDRILVVHAGVMSGKIMSEHTPFELTEMRSVSESGEAEKICKDPSRQWAKLYNGEIPGLGERRIVFGHDAARGLQLEKHATGLDTGCVYGKHLTCLVVQQNEPSSIVTVRSLQQYCKPEVKE